MKLTNKNIILTGASSGIGAMLLEKLCEYENVKIVAVARNIEEIPQTFNKVFAFSADLSTKEGVDSMFTYARNVLGKVDVFIANAGYAYIGELENTAWEKIESIYSLNTTSVIYSLGKFNELSKIGKRQFVTTISAAAFVPLHAYALYCSSKAALHQFIEAYRYECDKDLIISAIYPVATKTSFFDHASGEEDTPSPCPAQNVEKVVNKIITGIEKERKRIYPSLLFRLFYPIGRAFPFFLHIYSLIEKRKTKKWLNR